MSLGGRGVEAEADPGEGVEDVPAVILGEVAVGEHRLVEAEAAHPPRQVDESLVEHRVAAADMGHRLEGESAAGGQRPHDDVEVDAVGLLLLALVTRAPDAAVIAVIGQVDVDMDRKGVLALQGRLDVIQMVNDLRAGELGKHFFSFFPLGGPPILGGRILRI